MSESDEILEEGTDAARTDTGSDAGIGAGVLSDEELEALRGTGADHDDPDSDLEVGEGGCNLYDFRDPSRTLNGRLPGLDSVHEAFCNGMQPVLRTLLGRSVEVTSGETTLTRLGDYQKSFPLPTGVHAVNVEDRKHAMYLTVDGAFVYACVDAFFGGMSGTAPQALEREFSTSERRFMDMLATQLFRELETAWAPICGLRFGSPKTLKAGGMGNGRDDQIMVVSRFQVGLSPGHGEFHLALPYALLDALRPHLTAGPRGAEQSRNWRKRFADQLTDVDMETRSVFAGVRITFAELLSLQPGDFIPVSGQNRVVLMVDEQPIYLAEPGTANGMAAAKILERYPSRSRS